MWVSSPVKHDLSIHVYNTQCLQILMYKRAAVDHTIMAECIRYYSLQATQEVRGRLSRLFPIILSCFNDQ